MEYHKEKRQEYTIYDKCVEINQPNILSQ